MPPARPIAVCAHVHGAGDGYRIWFTGAGTDAAWVCEPCEAAFPAPPAWCEVDDAWWQARNDDASCEGVVGAPEVRTRDTGLRFEQTDVPWPVAIDLVDVAPLPGDAPRWLGLLRDGGLVDLDGATGAIDARRELTLTFPITAETAILAAPSGSRAVVYELSGSHGALINVATGAVVCALHRGTYRPGNSCFPVAFARAPDGRELLVVGSDWNRLELLDAATGANLALRPPVPSATPHPAHYLDYFHGSLAVSPRGTMIADAGWVWAPFGMVRTWSVASWLADPWASEDVPRAHVVAGRDYSWDEPMCWLDDTTLAVWGWGTDDAWIVPAITLFDVATGRERRWFPGAQVRHQGAWPPRRPAEALLLDGECLVAISDTAGTSVWDVATGERLLLEPAVAPRRYHPGARCFLSWDASGLSVSRLRHR